MPNSGLESPDIEHVEAYLASVVRETTARTYRYALVSLGRFIQRSGYIKAKPPYPVTGFDVDLLVRFDDWLKTNGKKLVTRDLYMKVARSFLVWLDANDMIPDFPMERAKNKLKVSRGVRVGKAGKEPDASTPSVVTFYDDIPLPAGTPENKVKRLVILRNRAIVHTLYATAGRVSEVASLTRESVLDGRMAEVRITGKGNKDRFLFLTHEAQRAIAAYCKERDDDYPGLFISYGRGLGQRLGRGTLWSVVKAAGKALGLSVSVSPHHFRHWRAQDLLDGGMDLVTLQDMLGHATPDTTRSIYAPHINKSRIRGQFDKFGRSAREAAKER